MLKFYPMSKHKIGESRWNASEMLITHICFIEELRHFIKIYCNSCLIQCYVTFLTPSSTEPLTHLVSIEIFSAKPEPTNPNSVTMKLEVALGFDSEDINVERESGGESADKEFETMKSIDSLRRILSNPLHSVPATRPISSQPIWRWCSNTSCSTT